MRNRCSAVLLFALGAVLSGCSSQQMYASGQAYQRQQCQRMPDASDRERCLSDSNVSYDDYQRERRPENQ